MGCGVYWQQINTVTNALRDLQRVGLDQIPAFDELSNLRAKLLTQVGFKFPRTPLQILKLVGLSPGEINVKFDPEFGWVSMARERLGAPPVYRRISAETAIQILSGKLTHELEEVLMRPEEVYQA